MQGQDSTVSVHDPVMELALALQRMPQLTKMVLEHVPSERWAVCTDEMVRVIASHSDRPLLKALR